MAKACSPFLVTVATLDKRAYKYIPEKHGGLHQHQAATPSPSPLPRTSCYYRSYQRWACKGSPWSCGSADAEFQPRALIDFNLSANANGSLCLCVPPKESILNLWNSCSCAGRRILKQNTGVTSGFCFFPCWLSTNICRSKQFQRFSPLSVLSCISHLSSPNRESDRNQDEYICDQLRSGVWHGDGELNGGEQYRHISEALPDSCWVFLDGCDYIYISWAGHRRRSCCFLWSHAPVPSLKIGSSSVERETKRTRAAWLLKKF